MTPAGNPTECCYQYKHASKDGSIPAGQRVRKGDIVMCAPQGRRKGKFFKVKQGLGGGKNDPLIEIINIKTRASEKIRTSAVIPVCSGQKRCFCAYHSKTATHMMTASMYVGGSSPVVDDSPLGADTLGNLISSLKVADRKKVLRFISDNCDLSGSVSAEQITFAEPTFIPWNGTAEELERKLNEDEDVDEWSNDNEEPPYSLEEFVEMLEKSMPASTEQD